MSSSKLNLIFKKRDIKGVKISGHKDNNDFSSIRMPVPEKVVIPMQQHIGAPCIPQVKKNDLVKVGQLIGDSDQKISAPIYSSVSGKVVDISDITASNGKKNAAITIESDGEQTMDESITVPVINSTEEFISAIRKSGLVGLGGAGFPAHFKLSSALNKNIDTFIINAAECEPYITSDNAEALENTERIIFGALNVAKHLDIKNVIIAIEDNKEKSIQKIRDTIATSDFLKKDIYKDINVKLHVLKSSYPQGAEKVLIYNVTKRKVGKGQLPADVGVLVMNVSSVSFVGKYLKDGIPLITRRLTVTGNCISKSQNVIVLIGTRIADVVEFCGGYKGNPLKIIFGGPMMGISVYDDLQPVTKQNNAVLVVDEKWVKEEPETACIRCGNCIKNCPVSLMPVNIANAYKNDSIPDVKALCVDVCIECGTCSYGCPARIPLTQIMRLSKDAIRKDSKTNAAKKEANK